MNNHRLEILIALLVLILLLVVTIPHFLTVQRRGYEKRIQRDLTTLLSALQQYSIDYPQMAMGTGFRDTVVDTIREIEKVTIQYAGSYGQATAVNRIDHVPLLIAFLEKRGYLKTGQAGKYFKPDDMDVSLHYICDVVNEGNSQKLIFGLAVLWPFANSDVVQTELSKETALRFRHNQYTENPGPQKTYTTLLKKAYYFSPTNGMESYGFVYCDSLGNHSSE